MIVRDAAGERRIEFKDASAFPFAAGAPLVVFFSGLNASSADPMQMLPPESRTLVSRFSSDARKLQSAWARVLLLQAGRIRGLNNVGLIESPPEAPRLASDEAVLFTSIAHCRGAAAAAAADGPCGIDLELARSIPRKIEKLDFFMPHADDSVRKACLDDDRLFLALWGAWEASIKAGRPLRACGAELSAEDDRLDFIYIDGFLLTTRTRGIVPPSVVRYEDLVTNA